MYKYAVNIMSVPEIIERSQEDKSTENTVPLSSSPFYN